MLMAALTIKGIDLFKIAGRTDWDGVGGSTLPMRQMRRKASRAEV